MKKLICLLLVSLTTLFFGGCDTNDAAKERTPTAVTKAFELKDNAKTEVTEAEVTENNDEDSETEVVTEPETQLAEDLAVIDENGTYTSKDDVALYIYTYGCLPDNFITKKEAQALGWEGGSLEPYAPGMCIGGSYFGNYEGILPEAEGRKYTECDIDTLGASKRGAKRIVFSNDGLIYYTEDHYETFELLYGEE